jgi:predicted HTH transcriptional regulator
MEQSIQGYLGSLQLGEVQLFKNLTMVPVVSDYDNGLAGSTGMSVNLSERRQKAIEHIRKKGQISRREYAKQAGVSPETAKRDLTKLVEDGVLAVHRAGRSTIYKLIGS